MNTFNKTVVFFQLREGKRVTDCLKRSVKTASQVLDAGARTQIYAEMLDHYIH